jgi:hypothetical protein
MRPQCITRFANGLSSEKAGIAAWKLSPLQVTMV